MSQEEIDSGLISVIIPTYNRSQFLHRALDSVKSQSYRPVEVLLVDDGSTDDTEKVVQQWLDKNADSTLSLSYTLKDNEGPSSCRNIGIQQAKGEFIYFLDSDDYMHSNLLEEALRALGAGKADCVLFGFDTEASNGSRGTWLPPDQIALKSYFENELWGYTSSSVKTAKLIFETGSWNENSNLAEDYEFLGRALLNSKKTVVLQKPLLTVSKGNDDSLGSRKDSEIGLKHRLIAENSIIDEVQKHRSNIPEKFLGIYSDRLFKTAINMRAKGKCAFGKELGEMALGLCIPPQTYLSRLKRFVWSRGRFSCWVWFKLSRVFRFVKAQLARMS